jgi:hypothetical protein
MAYEKLNYREYASGRVNPLVMRKIIVSIFLVLTSSLFHGNL